MKLKIYQLLLLGSLIVIVMDMMLSPSVSIWFGSSSCHDRSSAIERVQEPGFSAVNVHVRSPGTPTKVASGDGALYSLVTVSLSAHDYVSVYH